MPKVKREKDRHWLIGESKAFDDSVLLPLLHTLVEERVGERRLLVRWEVHGKRFDHLNPVQAKSELVNGAESCHIALRPARLSQRAGAGRGGKYEL